MLSTHKNEKEKRKIVQIGKDGERGKNQERGEENEIDKNNEAKKIVLNHK